MKSKDDNRRKDFVGVNGETAVIVILDHYTRYIFGDTTLSKASPLEYLRHWLKTHSPQCNDKYVYMDQGGELYRNPEVRNLFKQFRYSVNPTGADTSRQNAVERYNRTIGNGIRALLIGADLPIKFWPYAFHHYLRLKNATIPVRGQTKSPTELATGKKDDLSKIRTFGCRVWVRQPGRRGAASHAGDPQVGRLRQAADRARPRRAGALALSVGRQ